MPNNYLSVLYKHIIQVENKNVGLKVCVCVCVAQTYHCPPPQSKKGGHIPPCPPPPRFLRQCNINCFYLLLYQVLLDIPCYDADAGGNGECEVRLSGDEDADARFKIEGTELIAMADTIHYDPANNPIAVKVLAVDKPPKGNIARHGHTTVFVTVSLVVVLFVVVVVVVFVLFLCVLFLCCCFFCVFFFLCFFFFFCGFCWVFFFGGGGGCGLGVVSLIY